MNKYNPNWEKIGKYMFFIGMATTIFGFLWKEIVLRGVGLVYIVYWMDYSWGIFIIGGLLWFFGKIGNKKKQ